MILIQTVFHVKSVHFLWQIVLINKNLFSQNQRSRLVGRDREMGTVTDWNCRLDLIHLYVRQLWWTCHGYSYFFNLNTTFVSYLQGFLDRGLQYLVVRDTVLRTSWVHIFAVILCAAHNTAHGVHCIRNTPLIDLLFFRLLSLEKAWTIQTRQLPISHYSFVRDTCTLIC